MISNVTSKYQTNYKPLTKTNPSFGGDKDILIVIAYGFVNDDKEKIRKALGDKAKEYTIHTAIGGKEGVEKAKECNPFLTITAYNMPEYGKPSGADLILALKNFTKNIIVKTFNWHYYGDKSKKAGIEKCEQELGATKYVYGSDDKMFEDSITAIINGTEPPKYFFQDKIEKLS